MQIHLITFAVNRVSLVEPELKPLSLNIKVKKRPFCVLGLALALLITTRTRFVSNPRISGRIASEAPAKKPIIGGLC